MAKRAARDFVREWPGCAGGVNARASQARLASQQLIAGVNVLLDEEGGATKRLGCLSHGTVGNPGNRVISAYVFYRGTNAAPHLLAQTSGGELFWTADPVANPIS